MNLSWQQDMKASPNSTIHYRNSICTITAVQTTLSYVVKQRIHGDTAKCEGMNSDRHVAEPPELFQLKCANDRYAAGINSTHFKRNNPLVCRVSARYNHGSTGSKQVYLA
jgi:hypothetical protein